MLVRARPRWFPLKFAHLFSVVLLCLVFLKAWKIDQIVIKHIFES